MYLINMNEKKLTNTDWAKTVGDWSVARERKYLSKTTPRMIDVGNHREIATYINGVSYGVPVVLFHGNPGSGKTVFSTEEDLEDIGVRSISFDRAGSGKSTRNEGLTIRDTAQDVLKILNELNIDRIALLAVSGGALHAAGTAALPELRERVSGLVILAGLAPRNYEISSDITQDNQAHFREAQENPQFLRRRITERAQRVYKNRFALMQELYLDLDNADFLKFAEIGLAGAIATGHAEGLGKNGDGLYDEIMAIYTKDLDVDLTTIQAPTKIWYAKNDPFANKNDSHWLSQQIPNAELIEVPDHSHFDSQSVRYGALTWLRNQHIGSEYTQKIDNLKNSWLASFIIEFNNTWETIPEARGEYGIFDEVLLPDGRIVLARDFIRDGIIKIGNSERYAEQVAAKTVLEEFNKE
jgi:pimeloyl-ACP methyl ester carboxylesterase